MSLLLNLLIILASAYVLIRAVNLFIQSSSHIARHLNISNYTIGFVLVALATSLPEMVVGVTSAVRHNPVLSFGDALGSNIALLTIVVALPGIIGSGLSTKQIFKSKDIYFTVVFSLLAIALSFDRWISRVDGTMLLIGYLVYTILFLKRGSPIQKFVTKFENINIYKEILIFGVSLVLLLLASEGIVGTALRISSTWGIALSYVGLSITALGTSLPEIAFVIGATGHSDDEIMGDIVGSVVANSTIVLGLSAVIHPIYTNGMAISATMLATLIIILIVFFAFAKSKERISKKESFVLFGIYITFVIVEYLIQGQH